MLLVSGMRVCAFSVRAGLDSGLEYREMEYMPRLYYTNASEHEENIVTVDK